MTESLDAVFRPESIAVIGASRRQGTIGWQIVDNVVRHGYTGAVYPVNPNARAVHSIAAYPSVSAIGAPVDLAVLTVPKELVASAVDDCGEAGIPALVVITAGFKEIGGDGVKRERALREQIKRYGMRLVGPNCLGILNTSPDLSLNATFAPTMPPPGPVSFISQSGAMGVTILDYAAEYGIGINHFASVGNKVDVSGNDLIRYWAADEGTRVILMYLESFGNPRKFTRLAREITRHTPIIAVKAGRTAAGARAASSHTGALAGMDATTDALLAQCGVIRVDTVEELFDLAMAFGHLPVPRGENVAIVTNAGGPGIIIADACESAGLHVTALQEDTETKLADTLPEEASTRNPVDMIASATPEQYRVALESVLTDSNVDAAIAAFVPPLGVRQLDVAAAIVEARRAQPDKPVLAVLMGREGLPQGRAELKEAGVPAYIFPESAARALAAMVRYGRWLRRPRGKVAKFEVDYDVVESILQRRVDAGGGYLSADDAFAVLAAYGIPVIERSAARSADHAAELAEELGFPVVLKILSPDIVHKTDVGGIAADLRTPDEVRSAYSRILQNVRKSAPDAKVDGIQVERFASGGRETILGMTLDPNVGPVLMFGLGGIYVEVLQDVAFRIEPVSDIDAEEMVRQVRGFRLLEGVRGESQADLEAITGAIQRISQLVAEHHRIVELDINPFLVFENGGLAVDARIRVEAARAAPGSAGHR